MVPSFWNEAWLSLERTESRDKVGGERLMEPSPTEDDDEDVFPTATEGGLGL